MKKSKKEKNKTKEDESLALLSFKSPKTMSTFFSEKLTYPLLIPPRSNLTKNIHVVYILLAENFVMILFFIPLVEAELFQMIACTVRC